MIADAFYDTNNYTYAYSNTFMVCIILKLVDAQVTPSRQVSTRVSKSKMPIKTCVSSRKDVKVVNQVVSIRYIYDYVHVFT